MASNVYTKNEILQSLASKGYFIDAYTLDTFFEKWRIEAIFEDEQGTEFFDKHALDLILENLFSAKNEPEKKEEETPKIEQTAEIQAPQPEIQPQVEINQPIQHQDNFEIKEEKLQINDNVTANLLNNIELSDGTPLINKIQENPDFSADIIQPQKIDEPSTSNIPVIENNETQNTKPGILAGAMEGLSGDNIIQQNNDFDNTQIIPPTDDNSDFDDISLLSESLEAQEKFRQYVVSELVKKNVDLNPKSNEFKLDISERTLNMIARTMAKKIAKYVNTIFSADAKNATQLENVKEENKKLAQRTKELEEQNRKLKLLLAESNKNLNSYKPSIFGLYKKVNPNK